MNHNHGRVTQRRFQNRKNISCEHGILLTGSGVNSTSIWLNINHELADITPFTG
jgi:hypothetical protein